MTIPQDVQQFLGRTAVDTEGSKVGKIGQVYLDEQTGQPLWITVATGMFGTRQSFAPIYGSEVSGDQLVLAVSKDLIKDAPSIDDDGQIDANEQDALYQHYAGYLGTGLSGYTDGGQAGYETGGQPRHADGDERAGGTPGVRGQDASGPTTDKAMTRSEEQLRVGTETVEGGRARLRKYVVTENVSTTVPVSHEEVRVERERITDANRDAALSGEPISEEEHEVVLRA
jgi:stress response protein YsnF